MDEMHKRLLHHLVRQGKMSKQAARKAGVDGLDLHMRPKSPEQHFNGEVQPKEGITCPKCGYSLDHIPVAATAGEACPACGYGWAEDVPRKAMGGMMVGHSPSGMAHGGIKHFTGNLATERSQYARGGMVKCAHCGYGQDRSGECVRCGNEMMEDSGADFARALKFRRR
jgi:uncharacterized paraquat-inducible protein A